MNAIAIPRTITKGEELVIIPRKVYDRLVRIVEKKQTIRQKQQPLNKGLREALLDVKAGRVIGPFSSVDEGMQFLKHAK